MSAFERVFIAIGSNMGQREENCRSAVRAMALGSLLRPLALSPLYESAPAGVTGQRAFVNAVLEARSALGPMALLCRLRSMELAMGRTRKGRWGPRVMDLDILFYGRRTMDTPVLTIPHPRAHERAFVLLPMNDLAPEFIHPVLGLSMRGLLSGLGAGTRGTRPLGEGG